MEREANDEHGRRDEQPGDDEHLGEDDQEFSSVEDVGTAPGESPSVDDV
ncbi:MAG TPA: hypothetical protein VHT05_09920 [Candidatus Elarobacter sp.]|jgi:hypothetical protein|nr:hypothetical protein [Candidatus Elarobacter sp.]